MLKCDPKVLIPPRFLVGISLLFWGAATGNVLVAVVLAIVLDGQRWVPLKWEFDENSHVKAFQLSLLLVAVGVALSWLGDEGRSGALNVVRWSPLMFFPVEFVQRYGLRDRVNLNSFFYFSRKRMAQDVKEGREVFPIQINTGYPYILGVLIAASTSEVTTVYFFAGLFVLMVWLISSVIRERGLALRWLLVMTPVVALFGFGAALSMSVAYKWAKEYMNGGLGIPGNNTILTDFTSHLSDLGDVQQNPKIEWRVWSDQNPEYLRLASHNRYRNGRWTYAYGEEGFGKLAESYQQHDRSVFEADGIKFTYFSEDDRDDVESASLEGAMKIRGTVTHHLSSSVVPTPPGYFAVFDILGDEAYAEVNSMGSLHFENREMVIDYSLLAGADRRVVDQPPIDAIDLEIPDEEEAVISELADKLEIRAGQSAYEVIDTIGAYFNTEFEYSTKFNPGEVDFRRSKIEWFLNDIRKGHCEYYATSAILLLREVGIPARYATGYAVSEWGGDCWNVRGTSGHAWARAYVDGNWVNVDLTPPDYRGAGSHASLGPAEWLRERISLIREDFFIWRLDPANSGKFVFRAALVAGALFLWFAYRLWRQRQKRDQQTIYGNGWSGDTVVTPLNKLEKWIARRVGPRQRGEPFGVWAKKLESVDGIDREKVTEAIRIHQLMRFDADSKELSAELSALVKSLKKLSRK